MFHIFVDINHAIFIGFGINLTDNVKDYSVGFDFGVSKRDMREWSTQKFDMGKNCICFKKAQSYTGYADQ